MYLWISGSVGKFVKEFWNKVLINGRVCGWFEESKWCIGGSVWKSEKKIWDKVKKIWVIDDNNGGEIWCVGGYSVWMRFNYFVFLDWWLFCLVSKWLF